MLKCSSGLMWTTKVWNFAGSGCISGLCKKGLVQPVLHKIKHGYLKWTKDSVLNSCSTPMCWLSAKSYVLPSSLSCHFPFGEDKQRMKGNKKPTLSPLLPPSISYSTESPGTAQMTHKKSQEPLRTVVNCQEKSSHEQTCYGEMELAAKLPGFHVFLVPFQTCIEKTQNSI